MKQRREHVVPLSRQSLAILGQPRALSGDGRLVFPALGKRDRPISENTATAALRRMGFGAHEMTAHGFRAMASTLLNESGKWSPDAIERALAHKDGDNVRAAYHRGAHWNERVMMAQWWSDNLDVLRAGADILSFKGRKPASATARSTWRGKVGYSGGKETLKSGRLQVRFAPLSVVRAAPGIGPKPTMENKALTSETGGKPKSVRARH
jgi:hypothetical protein